LKKQLLKKEGIYLITGGAGGLGRIFSRYLLEQYQARLILTGRSPLDDEKRAFVSELKQLSDSDIIYLQTDVSDHGSMKEAIQTIQNKYGSLNGVIHAAGILSETPITHKNPSEFKRTLKPKIHGTIIIDQVTQNEPLDFFILFSSISSVLGDFGQCDYAIANRFIDSFTQKREALRKENKRKGKTIAINWPLWHDGGLHGDPEAEHFYLKSSGFSYLSTKKGLEAFEKILAGDHSQVILMSGHPDSINKIVHSEKEQIAQFHSHANGTTFVDMNEGDFLDGDHKIISEIQAIASDILKIKPENLHPDENFGNFGFDSLSLKMLANDINNKYHIELLPATFFAQSNFSKLGRYLLKTYPQIQNRLSEKNNNRLSHKHLDQASSKTVFTSKTSEKKSTETIIKDEPIAIIGMHGVFPGAKDLAEFWKQLKKKADLITEIPKSRWNWEHYYGDPNLKKNHILSKWGGFISDIDAFDPHFFHITPQEAQYMDPQHRLFIETVWKTIEDAGYQSSQLSGKPVGIFAGMQFNDYYQLIMEQNNYGAFVGTGNADAMLANRISYIMDWRGPSETIDTACSSSLVAIHRAISSIRSGECPMAVAGAVSLIIHPGPMVAAGQLGILSSDGRCKTFDKSANGYVKGEGVGAVLLKPLSQALKEKDHIYAIIIGSTVNHGGRASSLTAPNSDAQADLIVSAYQKAGIDPQSITYLELHGTGTEIGDPVEIEGIKKAFNECCQRDATTLENDEQNTHYCGIGTVKTNIGHLEPAAGIAGLIKVILSMTHQTLPGTPHFHTLNPYIDLHNTPFYVVKDTKVWKRRIDQKGNLIPLRAGISSFGFGGANAHVILEEMAQDRSSAYIHTSSSAQIIPLSARNKERLREYAIEMKTFLEDLSHTENAKQVSLENIAYTLQTGRDEMRHRLAMIVTSIDEFNDKLTQFIQGDNDIAHLYLGKNETRQIKSKSEKLSIPKDSNHIFNKKELIPLANKWVSGAKIIWKDLHPKDGYHRISLPTYPFARTKYWIPKKSTPNEPDHLNSLIDKIDVQRSLNHDGLVFLKQFKQSDPIVFDHKVHERSLLPGTAYLEIFYEAARLIKKNPSLRISHVVFQNALTIIDEIQHVYIAITSQDDILNCDVFTDHNNQRTIHARGSILSNALEIKDKQIPIDTIKANGLDKINTQALYQHFKKIGLNYGKHFKGIKQIWGNEIEALSFIEFSLNDEFASKGAYTIHPGVADAAFQTIAGISYDQNISDLPRVPFSIESIDIVKPLQLIGYAYAKHVGQNLFDLSITDNSGNVCIHINHLYLKAFHDSDRISPEIPSWETMGQKLNSSTNVQEFNNKKETSDSFQGSVENTIVKCLSEILGISNDEIDVGNPFSDYGLDSISGISLINKLTEDFNISLRTTLIFDYPSIKELSHYICDTFSDQLSINVTETSRPEKADVPKEIASEIFFQGNPRQTLENKSFKSNIAIIGISCRFPDAFTIREFWNNISQGKDSVTSIPNERLASGGFDDPDSEIQEIISRIKGGFIKDVDQFDPLFFNMSGKEAVLTDPRQRIFLQECWSALEDAGYAGNKVSGMKCGVFAGVSEGDYNTILKQGGLDREPQTFWGNASSVLSSRIAYFLNLKGPSITIDTACSSSLTAVHLACQSIHSGESDIALAGGVFICFTPRFHILAENAGMLSPTGRCSAFDDSADGFVTGEGAAALILKPLEMAIADGDHIYGMIKGSGVNQDGKSNGITAPSTLSQTALEISVYETSGIHPETISYVETHGTGTKLGDPIEIEALTNAFENYTQQKGFCPVGSVKSNIGHAAAAAGAASLIKVLLAFKYKKIPPSLHFKQENAFIPFKDTPFYVNTRLSSWETIGNTPRRAAVSSFGFSGTNAHIVLEEYSPPALINEQSLNSTSPYIFVLSAKTKERLKVYAKNMSLFLKSHDELSNDSILRDMTWTLQTSREVMDERLAIVISTIDELMYALKCFSNGMENMSNMYCTHSSSSDNLNNLDTVDATDIKNLLKKRDTESLARLWVSGVSIDWIQWYEHQPQPNKISLPTYPFAKESYWPELINRNAPQTRTMKYQFNGLHPLIDSNESTLDAQMFKKVFHSDHFLLRDHVVDRNMMLPGAAFLEMARAAGSLARKQMSVLKMAQITWISPLRTDDLDSSREVFIHLWSEGAHVEYEITTASTSDDLKKNVHSRGTLIYGNDNIVHADTIDIEFVKNRCTEMMTSEESYAHFKSQGLHYGPSFQTIQTINFNDSEAIASIVLPQQFQKDFELFGIHPLLIDGAWQTLIGISDKSDVNLFVPFALDEVIFLRPLKEKCFAYAHLHNSADTSRFKKFDIDILDNTGQQLLKMKGFSIKALPKKTIKKDDDLLQMLNKLSQGSVTIADVQSLV
jgi:acyl transferase domain-containing protein/acyl carrier protein/NAD(P)-dependent dehydrogenase (short-subunit alcohol dehydrogenase family)